MRSCHWAICFFICRYVWDYLVHVLAAAGLWVPSSSPNHNQCGKDLHRDKHRRRGQLGQSECKYRRKVKSGHFPMCFSPWLCYLLWGEGGEVPANTTTGRGVIHERQEGNPVRHNLVSHCCFKLLTSDTVQLILDLLDRTILEKGFLVAIILTPCAQ